MGAKSGDWGCQSPFGIRIDRRGKNRPIVRRYVYGFRRLINSKRNHSRTN